MAQAERTLKPGDEIAHYRVVGPLGAGGMGEVYLAQDQSLERNVALKVLPPEVVRSEERVRRFMLEAKSASSLNHPNIVTIYEIGHDAVRSTGSSAGSSESSAVHFISMELVSGKTLSTLIHDEKTDLRTLLGYLAQCADGLAKAHAAGIVHRDLKPGNIMVSADGFAKVLDFGLAKLTENRASDPELTSAQTVAADATGAGVVLGTTGYMSPEQVQGKPVDQRSDIFSFGAILYEAATGRRPFAAESSVETMHKIINDKPPAVEELNPRAPTELRRLIRRCLAKNPEQRLQSMKDLALELREIVEDYDTLTPSGSSGSGSSMTGAAAPARRSPTALIVGGVIAVVGLAIGYYGLQRGAHSGANGPFSSVRMTNLTSRGDAQGPVLSPDARYVAFGVGPDDQRSLWVRQIATGSDVQVLPPQSVAPYGLQFSPDGNYLFYLQPDLEHRGYKALYQIPTLGGTPRKRTYDVDSRVTFEPGGKRVCYVRGLPAEDIAQVILFDLETSTEQVLATIKSKYVFGAFPEWSPRGDRIAMCEVDPLRGATVEIALYAVKDGRRLGVKPESIPDINSMAWMPDGRALLVSGYAIGASPTSQISYVSIPDGHSRRITNDLNNYYGLSVSADGQSLLASQESQISNLWSVTADAGSSPRQLTFASSNDNSIQGFATTLDGTILFGAASDEDVQLYSIAADGSNRRALTSGRGFVNSFFTVPGGVVFERFDSKLERRIWRTDSEGSDPKRVTSSNEDEQLMAVSRDGNSVFLALGNAPTTLQVISPDHPTPHGISHALLGNAQLSPDGRKVAFVSTRTRDGKVELATRVIGTDGTGEDSLMQVPSRATQPEWLADASGFTYLDPADSAANVFRVTLGDGPPIQLTHISGAIVENERWSPDGRQLLLRIRKGRTANLWLADPTGTGLRPLTHFDTGSVFDQHWTPDSKSVVFTYGIKNSDAVMLRTAR